MHTSELHRTGDLKHLPRGVQGLNDLKATLRRKTHQLLDPFVDLSLATPRLARATHLDAAIKLQSRASHHS